MYDIEKAKKYAWEQKDWIDHIDGYFLLKDCIFFYHKGQIIFNPWEDLEGNVIDDPFSYYGADKMNEFCRRIIKKKDREDTSIEVTVDGKVLEFLKTLYFGVIDNPFEAASRSAYTDMCRTIRFNGKNGSSLRKFVDILLEEKIPELISVKDEKEFTQWHHTMCSQIVDIYHAEGIEFYIGQAQKWVNMTLKYLYVLVPDVVEPFYNLLHIPLDNYIMDIAKKQYGVPALSCAWSRITDYDEYLKYERMLMEVIDEIPLDWEFSKWVESARQQKSLKVK